MVSEYHLLRFCQEIFGYKSCYDHRQRHEFYGGNNCRTAWKKKNEDEICNDSRMTQNPVEGWMLLWHVIGLPTNDVLCE